MSGPHAPGHDGPTAAPAGPGWQRAGRAAARGGRRGVSYLASTLITASAPRGARESGLTALIWNQVLSYGADAMVTVALAGTVFFSASADAQRGNVLQYLLITMAPFAVVAPVIGPAMDRLQHGRRITMAVTAVGRAVLALVMAAHFTNLLVLFPCALGSLVLSKAYAVIRAAAAPRLVPTGMTLVEANSRLSVFGLGAAVAGGALVGVVIKVTGSYQVGLVLTALTFGVSAYSSVRLPRAVDAAGPLRPPPGTADRRGHPSRAAERPGRADPGDGRPSPDVRTFPPTARRTWARRLLDWARRGLSPAVVVGLQATCGLRFLTGFLTLFLAFHVQATAHGWEGALELAAIGAGAGAGNLVGNLAGARVRAARPERVVLWSAVAAAVAVLVGAAVFLPLVAVAVIFVASVAASLAKIQLDSLVQRDVGELTRASAFGRSEAFLQLAWVLGGTIALLLPAGRGWLGFLVVGVLLGATLVAVALRARGGASTVTGPGTGPGRPVA